MNKLIQIVIVILLPLGTIAQQGQTQTNSMLYIVQQHEQGKGTIVIHQDQHITQLLNNRLWQNSKNPGMQGFRIRIFSELGQTARQRSTEVMNAFMQKYPGVKVYQSYENPYWKISIGNFRNKESAQRFYQEILKDYPKAFLIPDWIYFPTLE